jgi:hypothetical protein
LTKRYQDANIFDEKDMKNEIKNGWKIVCEKLPTSG